jgi:hypothetical protein
MKMGKDFLLSPKKDLQCKTHTQRGTTEGIASENGVTDHLIHRRRDGEGNEKNASILMSLFIQSIFPTKA